MASQTTRLLTCPRLAGAALASMIGCMLILRHPGEAMAGTIGVAPAEPGHHSIIPPRRVGGNMDVRDIAEGTELYLPIEVAGGL